MGNIVILEDEEVLGRVYSKKLKEHGFMVEWVKNTDDLEERLEQEKQIDIVLLDHGMQGTEKTGLEMIPYVKSSFPEAKVIMLSNYSSFTLEKNALKEGALSCLVKLNTSPDALVSYLQTIAEG